MKIRQITTAGAPLGVATQAGGLSGTSRVMAVTGLFGSRGFDRVPELPPGPGQVPGGVTRERRRTQARQEQSRLAGPVDDERESR
jgi:hypothetical protein